MIHDRDVVKETTQGLYWFLCRFLFPVIKGNVESRSRNGGCGQQRKVGRRITNTRTGMSMVWYGIVKGFGSENKEFASAVVEEEEKQENCAKLSDVPN